MGRKKEVHAANCNSFTAALARQPEFLSLLEKVDET
jgi:hypothetical protein